MISLLRGFVQRFWGRINAPSSGGARNLEQVGPAAGPKVVW